MLLKLLPVLLFITACTKKNLESSNVTNPDKLQKQIDEQASVNSKNDFRDSLLRELSELRPNWKVIEVSEASRGNYTAKLLYKNSPTSKNEIEADGKKIVQAMLKVLIKEGRKPAEEQIFVRLSLQENIVGETGQ